MKITLLLPLSLILISTIFSCFSMDFDGRRRSTVVTEAYKPMYSTVPLASQDGQFSLKVLERAVAHLSMMQFLNSKSETNILFNSNPAAVFTIRWLSASNELTKAMRKTTLADYSSNVQLTEVALWALKNQEEIDKTIIEHPQPNKTASIMGPDKIVLEKLATLFRLDKANYPSIISDDKNSFISIPTEVYQFFRFIEFHYITVKDPDTSRLYQISEHTRKTYTLPFNVQQLSLVVLHEAMCLIYNYLQQHTTVTLEKSGEDPKLIQALCKMLLFYSGFDKEKNRMRDDLKKICLELNLQALASALLECPEYAKRNAQSYLEETPAADANQSDTIEQWLDQIPEYLATLYRERHNIFMLSWIRAKHGITSKDPALQSCVSSLVTSLSSGKMRYTVTLDKACNFGPLVDSLRSNLSNKDIDLHELLPTPELPIGTTILENFYIEDTYQLLVTRHPGTPDEILLVDPHHEKIVAQYPLPEQCVSALLIDDNHDALALHPSKKCAIATNNRVIVVELTMPKDNPPTLNKTADFAVDGLMALAVSTQDQHFKNGAKQNKQAGLIIADNNGIRRCDTQGRLLQPFVQANFPIKGIATKGSLVICWQEDGTLYIWDNGGRCVKVKLLAAPSNEDALQAVGILNDGTLLASVKGKGVLLLDHAGKVIKRLAQEGKKDTVTSWCEVNEALLALGNERGYVTVWEKQNEKMLKPYIVPPTTGGIPLSISICKGVFCITYSTGVIAKVFLSKYASVADLMYRISPSPSAPRVQLEAAPKPLQPLIPSETNKSVTVLCDKKEYFMHELLYKHCKFLGIALPHELNCIHSSYAKSLPVILGLWSAYNLESLFKKNVKKASLLTLHIIQWSLQNQDQGNLSPDMIKQTFENSPENVALIRPLQTLKPLLTKFATTIARKELAEKEPLEIDRGNFTDDVFCIMIYLISNTCYTKVTAKNDELLVGAMASLLEYLSTISDIDRSQLLHLAVEHEVPQIAHAALSHLKLQIAKNLVTAEQLLTFVNLLDWKLTSMLEEYDANQAFLFTCIFQKLAKKDSPRNSTLKNALEHCSLAFVESLEETIHLNPYFLEDLKKDVSLIPDACCQKLIGKYAFDSTKRKKTDPKPEANYKRLMKVVHLIATGQEGQDVDSLFVLNATLIAFSHENGVVHVWNRARKKIVTTVYPESTVRVHQLSLENTTISIMYKNGSVTRNSLTQEQIEGRIA